MFCGVTLPTEIPRQSVWRSLVVEESELRPVDSFKEWEGELLLFLVIAFSSKESPGNDPRPVLHTKRKFNLLKFYQKGTKQATKLYPYIAYPYYQTGIFLLVYHKSFISKQYINITCRQRSKLLHNLFKI